MTDTEKPFVCPSQGCNMSFTNEDHLTVHKKKHDMVLNLGNNGKNTVFVDQTPTPTRFIRNCEEIGLFQDLQNVNPFEETFRRAVEAGKTGTLSLPEATVTDDTLHTPHIFPHIIVEQSSSTQILSDSSVQDCPAAIVITEKTDYDKTISETEICSSLKLSSNDALNLIEEKHISKHKQNNLMLDGNIPILPKLAPIPTNVPLSINGEEVQLLLKTADGKLMQLSAIPVRDTSSSLINTINQTKQSTVIIKTEPSLKCTAECDARESVAPKLSLAKMKLRQVLTKSVDSQNQNTSEIALNDDPVFPSKKENQKGSNDTKKKLDSLERNRASSMRARAKRKAWIQQLQKTVNNVNDINNILQTEVKSLRSEVTRLKSLLLAHKDCPVTKSMQKGNSVILGSKLIPINPEIMDISSVNNVPLKRIISTESSKSKKVLSVTTKSPVILPKIDINLAPPIQTTAIVNNLPIKIVEVSPFITNKKESKQILIVQSTQESITEALPRQIIQINPNYEVENAASKSTGA